VQSHAARLLIGFTNQATRGGSMLACNYLNPTDMDATILSTRMFDGYDTQPDAK
jgi:hypothetical protein